MLASCMFVVITQNVFVYFEMGQNIPYSYCKLLSLSFLLDIVLFI